MDISILKVFAIFGVVSAWVKKAFADGKISVQEGIELVVELAEAIGIPLEWDIPEGVRKVKEDIEKAHGDLTEQAVEADNTVEHDA